MAIEIKYDLTTQDGKPISVMSDVIKARRDELGETSKQSTVAMTINILKALRADTRVAKIKGNYQIKNVDGKFYPSFAKVDGKTKPVLRNGKKGDIVTPDIRVIWKIQRGVKSHCYYVKDVISESKTREYLLVCLDAKAAKEYVSEIHEKRVKEHKGLAKICLGMAMHEVHKSENVNDLVTLDTMRIALKSAEARVNESGYNSGNINIYVHDKIDYAGDALKHGPNYVSTAVKKTLNKMMAYIIHRLHGRGIQTDLQIPYEELKEKTK